MTRHLGRVLQVAPSLLVALPSADEADAPGVAAARLSSYMPVLGDVVVVDVVDRLVVVLGAVTDFPVDPGGANDA